jgi:hypothetical protein
MVQHNKETTGDLSLSEKQDVTLSEFSEDQQNVSFQESITAGCSIDGRISSQHFSGDKAQGAPHSLGADFCSTSAVLSTDLPAKMDFRLPSVPGLPLLRSDYSFSNGKKRAFNLVIANSGGGSTNDNDSPNGDGDNENDMEEHLIARIQRSRLSSDAQFSHDTNDYSIESESEFMRRSGCDTSNGANMSSIRIETGVPDAKAGPGVANPPCIDLNNPIRLPSSDSGYGYGTGTGTGAIAVPVAVAGDNKALDMDMDIDLPSAASAAACVPITADTLTPIIAELIVPGVPTAPPQRGLPWTGPAPRPLHMLKSHCIQKGDWFESLDAAEIATREFHARRQKV